MIQRIVTCLFAAGMLLAAGSAQAASTPEAKCRAGKNKAAGKYAACRQLAEAKLASTAGICSVATGTKCQDDHQCPGIETCVKDQSGYGAALAKCDDKLGASWQKLEDKTAASGTTCLDSPLALADFRDAIDLHTDDISNALAGNGFPAECGNGALEPGEECDAGALGGATCDALYAGTTGPLICAVDCTIDAAACTAPIHLRVGHTLGDTAAAELAIAAARTGNSIASVGFDLSYDGQTIPVTVLPGGFASAAQLRQHIQNAVDSALVSGGESADDVVVALGDTNEILLELPAAATASDEGAIALARSGNSIAGVEFSVLADGMTFPVIVTAASFANLPLLINHIQLAIDLALISGGSEAGAVVAGLTAQ